MRSLTVNYVRLAIAGYWIVRVQGCDGEGPRAG